MKFNVLSLAVLLCISQMTYAQTETPLRGGLERMGGGLVTLAGDDVQISVSSGQSWSTTSRTENGVTITKGSSSKFGEFEIREDEDGNIEVTLTQEYGVEDADKIMESHPELYMYLKAMPEQIGDSKVEIKFNVSTTYKADSPEHLKEQNEVAFEVYEGAKNGGSRDIRALRDAMRARIIEGRLDVPVPRRIGSVDGRDSDEESVEESAEATEEERAEAESGEVQKPEKAEGQKRSDGDSDSEAEADADADEDKSKKKDSRLKRIG